MHEPITLEIDGRRVETIGFETSPYPARLRERLLECTESGGAHAVSQLNFELGELYAKAARHAMDRFGAVELIGCSLEEFERVPGCSFAPGAAYLRSIIE